MRPNSASVWRLASASAVLCLLGLLAIAGQQASNGGGGAPPAVPPPERRPRVRVNIREWSKLVSEDIRLVSNRSSCTQKIGQFYQREAQFQRVDAAKLRDSILVQISALLSQHRAALGAIVSEAEQAALAHKYQMELRSEYVDVHRLRNSLESQQSQIEQELAAAANAQAALNTNPPAGSNPSGGSPGSNPGDKGGPGGGPTGQSGGTPVPGPPEWQTPMSQLELRVNKNFGDVPVNTSTSAVHLPLAIYPGLPLVMNGIAWSAKLDQVFRRNLEQFAHVHHQYYGDHLGFLRTFPVLNRVS